MRFLASALLLACLPAFAQQPAEPTDITPLNGETYYVINQLTGLQMDLNNGTVAKGAAIVENTATFTSLSQRWAFTRLAAGIWKISNTGNLLCLDAATSGSSTNTVQNTCSPATTQQWTLTPTSSGYYTIGNVSTGLTLDLSAASAGAALDQTPLGSSATQSQQWLLRPAFFRGVDNALLEKQEANKVTNGVPWWNDAGQTQDLLQILKNHGVNLIRIRPTTEPPYNTYTSTTCTGNGCYAETEAQDLDLAKRAKKLGMSIELSFFFDGGSSVAVPGAWSSYSLSQAETALYTYVKAEIEEYRAAGVMPDLVAIGNEVDTGFLSALGTSPGSSFSNFAAMEIQGMQAVLDASSDTSIGPAIPPPLRCIHITPADNLSSFFTSAKNYSIPYDAMCQSYYPLYHGPLTAAQAATTNPSNKPIEQSVLNAAATLGKPIFLIEVGEHYENGFDANDPWYPATVVGQRQFLIDVTNVVKNIPNNLGMGIEYWDATGINVFKAGGGYTNGDGTIDSLYSWNGLTLFDNADTQGYSNASLPNFSATLPGLDALGGKEDQTLNYKLVNQVTGQILETSFAATAANSPLDTTPDTGVVSLHQQWTINSNGDGYFQIRNANGGTNVLDDQGSATKGSAVVQNTVSATVTAAQEWNVVSAGNGYFALVNKSSGLVLDAPSGSTIEQTAASSITTDWVIPAANTQLWQIVPVHISATSTPSQLQLATGPAASYNLGSALGTYTVNVVNSAGAIIGSPTEAVTLTVNGPQGFTFASTVSSSNGTASFNLSSITLSQAGTYNVVITATGLTGTGASFSVIPAVLTVTAQNQGRSYGVANPTLTYTFSGFVNGDNSSVVSGAAAVSTTATLASAPGTYPISIAQGTLAASNYTFTFVPGTLTVGQAGTATRLATSATTANSGDSVTLTATVTTSVTGTPTGTVTFLNAGGQIGGGTLNGSGVATYTTTALPSAINSITAVYQGDTNFLGSTSSAVTVTVSPQNIWLVNGNGTLSELTNAGAAISSGSGYAGGGSTIAIDNTGFVWSASASTLTRVTNVGAAAGSFTGGGLSGPTALAIDGSGQIWAANANNTLSQFSNAGAAISPASGYSGPPLSTPSALAIDAAGNLWLANSGDSSVTEILGAADPVVTPLATAVKTSTLGAKP